MKTNTPPINLKLILWLAGITATVLFLYKIQSILSTFAVSFFIAYLFDPLVDVAERRKIPRALTIIILFLLMSIILGAVLAWLMPLLYHEAVFLGKKLPAYADKLLAAIEQFGAGLGFDTSQEGLKVIVGERIGSLSKIAVDVSGDLLQTTGDFVSFLLNASLVPILVFYFLKDFDDISARVMASLQKKFSTDIPHYLRQFNGVLSTYLRGQVIVALFLAVLYTAVLLTAGVKPAILLGLTAGVLSIVPYLGFLVGFSSAVILSYVQGGGLTGFLILTIGFAVVQAVEGNVITPKVVGKSLGLHPVMVIFSLMAGGYLMGISGMILALPVAAFLRIVASPYIDVVEEDGSTGAAEG